MPPIVIRTCYDGDHFGEQVFFTARIGQQKVSTMTEDEYIKQQIRLSTNEDGSASASSLSRLNQRDRLNAYADELKDLTQE